MRKLTKGSRPLIITSQPSSFIEVYIIFFFLFADRVGLGLLHGLVTANSTCMWSLALHPTSSLEDQEVNFVWPLPLSSLVWVALQGAYTPAISLGQLGAKTPSSRKGGRP
jgi:hypothetical protein